MSSSTTETPYGHRDFSWKKKIAARSLKRKCDSLSGDFNSSCSISKNTDVSEVEEKFSRMSVKGKAKRCRMDNCRTSSIKKPHDINFAPKKNEVYCESHWYAAQAWRAHKKRKRNDMNIATRINRGEGSYFAGRIFLPKHNHGILLDDIPNMLRKPRANKNLIREDDSPDDSIGDDGNYDEVE